MLEPIAPPAKAEGAPTLTFRTINEPLSVDGLIVPFRQIRLSSPVEAILRKVEVKEGDRILFGKYSGTEIKVENQDYLILREDEIIGIFTPAGKAAGKK